MRDIAAKARTVVGALLLLLALSIAPALAEEYSGKVVGITDGDTLTLLMAEKRQVKVRLSEIDTPSCLSRMLSAHLLHPGVVEYIP